MTRFRSATVLKPECLDDGEQRARVALEARRGTSYPDAEWEIARQNLLAFFLLLAEWDGEDHEDTDDAEHG